MDTQRLILLMIFSFSLIMLWDAWQQQQKPKPPEKIAAAPTASQAPKPSAELAPTPTAGAVPPPTEVVASQGQSPTISVTTDLMKAEISATGGDLVRVELLQHKATADKKKNFVLLDPGVQHTYLAQTGLIGDALPTHKAVFSLPPGPLALKTGQDKLQVRLEAAASPEGIKVAKILTFARGSYVIDVAYEVTNTRQEPLSLHSYFQLVRDGKAPPGETTMLNTFTGVAVYSENEKFQKVEFGEIEKASAKHAKVTDNGWIGIVQHYFVSAWLPPGKGEREFFTRKLADNLYAAGVILPVASIAPGATGRIEVPLYAGPQEQDKLSRLAPGLDLVVDYGWLTVIAAPIFWVLQWIHGVVGNWGWAIIALTVLIKLIFFPLSAASYKSMARMRVVTPKMMKIKEQYGSDRVRMNQEMMELYKREKINPLGGCLPILVQIPVFIALYWVLLASVEMRDAPWIFWIKDLSTKDPFFVLPLIMGATMFIQTKLNPTPPDPIQAKVMLAMPVVFTVMFLFFPAGLVLYWTVNNVLSIAQQWQITRMIEGGKTAAAK